MTTAELKARLETLQARANLALESALGDIASEFNDDAASYLQRLFEASRYALNGGGKRIRPALVYAAAEAISDQSISSAALDTVGCAVELIHAYSLVHDDLPAMDDDDLRRGQPTTHIAYDEATAILVGDALQARAFEILSEADGVDDASRLRLIKILAAASGGRGMVGGQAIDVAATDTTIDLIHLQAMYALKTGALIRASVSMGAVVAGASEAQIQSLGSYAQAVGLAFQVCDDILDATSDTSSLGKVAQADEALNKPTYVRLLGLEGARATAVELLRQAESALLPLPLDTSILAALARFIVSREH